MSPIHALGKAVLHTAPFVLLPVETYPAQWRPSLPSGAPSLLNGHLCLALMVIVADSDVAYQP